MASVDDRRWRTNRATGQREPTGYTGPKPWRARYRTPDGAQRSQCFARKVDAERFLTTVEASKLTGAYVDPSAGRVTVQDYAERWRAAQVWRRSTSAAVETHLRRHVYPTLGDRALGAVKPSEVQAWVRHLTTALEPATVEVVYRHLAAVFRAAVADRLIASSPCTGVRLPKVVQRQVEPLSVDQVLAVAEAMPPELRALPIVGAGTGLRPGELLGLTVDRVDFLRRQVHVDRQLVTHQGGGVELGDPKTLASVRTVPVGHVVVDALAAHLAAHEAGSWELVFTIAGEPIRRQTFGRAWRAAATAAGLPATVRAHDLRHTYASVLIAAGASVKVVQERLGHASARETLDTYAHLWPDDEDRTRAAIDEAFGSLGSASCVTDVSRPGF